MTRFYHALWAESLKARRSLVPLLSALGFALAPLVGGLFMVILKDPEQARAMGLIGAKAQLTAGVADWPTYFGLLAQAVAVGGAIIFAIITAWVFGREFSDRTAVTLLALPTPRAAIVAAKFVVEAIWMLGLSLLVFALGLVVGSAVALPGWSAALAAESFANVLLSALLTALLMPFVAFFASAGRGYLPAVGWAFLTVALANIVTVLGWGSWFPWAVPALASGVAGSRVEPAGLHSYVLVVLTCMAGLAATFGWWLEADQTR